MALSTPPVNNITICITSDINVDQLTGTNFSLPLTVFNGVTLQGTDVAGNPLEWWQPGYGFRTAPMEE